MSDKLLIITQIFDALTPVWPLLSTSGNCGNLGEEGERLKHTFIDSVRKRPAILFAYNANIKPHR